MGTTKKRLAHLSLKAYPALFLLAQVIDPDGKEKQEDVLAAIGDKFNLETNSILRLNNQAIKHIEREDHKDLYFEINVTGFIRLYHEYVVLRYRKGKKVWEINHAEHAILEVNGKEIDIINGWDEEHMLEYRERLACLFDQYGDKSYSWTDIFKALWSVFPKGSKDDAHSTFRGISQRLSEIDDEDTSNGNKMTKWSRWVADRYLQYLWEQYDNGREIKHILGLRSFITRNEEAWLKGEDMHEVSLNIYTDEHDEAVKVFKKLEEKDLPYLTKSLNIRILQVWNLVQKIDDCLF